MNISFTIYGIPIPKGRPKFWHRGKNSGTYTPKKTRTYEDSVISQALAYKFDKPSESPIELRLKFFLPMPQMSKKKRLQAIQGELRPIKKPDMSNLIKSIEDPLNTIFWKDDKQIVNIQAEKFYGEQPRTEVEISEI